MPASSEKQRRLFGAALAYKRGENPGASSKIKEMSKSMSEDTIKDFASKKKACLSEFDQEVLRQFYKKASACGYGPDEATELFFAGLNEKLANDMAAAPGETRYPTPISSAAPTTTAAPAQAPMDPIKPTEAPKGTDSATSTPPSQ